MMSKVARAFICASVAFASIAFAEVLYSDKVVSLYLNATDTKPEGRLLPTNAFEIIKQDSKKVLVRISGFVNPKAPSVLYTNDSQRVMVAAFGKNTKLEFKSRVAGSGGKWDKVSIEVWADKGEFVNDRKPMFAKAKTLYSENCGICHATHKESEFGANQWQAVFNSMVNRTAIDQEDRWLVIEYLQKNGKDYYEK